jgi:hypothetical protein
MHYLRDYAQAVAHAARVKPLRGDGQGRKPYGDRRHGRTFYITDEGERGVAVTLYSTVIVRFMPDGTIMVDGTYRSKTTAEAIWQVLGAWVSNHDSKMWIGTDKGREPLRTDGATSMRRLHNNQLEMVEPNPVIIHKVDRKAMNAVWRRYAAFRDYLHVTLSLGGERGYSQAHVAAILGVTPNFGARRTITSLGNPALRVAALMLVDMMRPDADPETWAKAAMELMLVRNNYFALNFEGDEPSPTRAVTYKDKDWVMDHLRGVLRRAYRDEVFKEVEVPAGEIAKDRYGSYFSE